MDKIIERTEAKAEPEGSPIIRYKNIKIKIGDQQNDKRTKKQFERFVNKTKPPLKVLSEKHLDKAKLLGFTWKDLLPLKTRQKVIDHIKKYDVGKKAIHQYKNRLNLYKIYKRHKQIENTKLK